jgi:hypothetical protein
VLSPGEDGQTGEGEQVRGAVADFVDLTDYGGLF